LTKKKGDMMEKIYLFLNGEDITSDFSISYQSRDKKNLEIEKEKIIYVADGGLNLVLKKNISFEKMIWAGDRDSLNLESLKFLEEKKQDHAVEQIILNQQKDYSDFSLILDQLQEKYGNKDVLFLEIFGGLGGRRDHEIANIEEAKWFVSKLKKGGVCFFHGGVVVTNLAIEISNCKSKSISIFAPNGSVEIKGCAYSGVFSFERPSHGLSNLIESEVVEINSTKIAVIYLNSS
jgi:thiamine pyrophosphokinase